MNYIMNQWEHPPISFPKKEQYDVAIVLTGVTDNHRLPADRVYFNKGAERITTPLILYKRGIIDKILISGGTGSTLKTAREEALVLKQFLTDNQVPSNDIIIEKESKNTRQNALFTKTTLKDYPELKSKLLITSSFHMNRSVACFKKVGVEVTPFPVDFHSSNSNLTLAKLFIPNSEALGMSTKIIHEVVGYYVYKLVGYA